MSWELTSDLMRSYGVPLWWYFFFFGVIGLYCIWAWWFGPYSHEEE